MKKASDYKSLRVTSKPRTVYDPQTKELLIANQYLELTEIVDIVKKYKPLTLSVLCCDLKWNCPDKRLHEWVEPKNVTLAGCCFWALRTDERMTPVARMCEEMSGGPG